MINVKIQGFRHTLQMYARMTKASRMGLYAVESELYGVQYVADDGCLSISTCDGWMKMTREDAKVMAKEVLGICDDLDDLERMGVSLNANADNKGQTARA